jgi:hypothetical protein
MNLKAIATFALTATNGDIEERPLLTLWDADNWRSVNIQRIVESGLRSLRVSDPDVSATCQRVEVIHRTKAVLAAEAAEEKARQDRLRRPRAGTPTDRSDG